MATMCVGAKAERNEDALQVSTYPDRTPAYTTARAHDRPQASAAERKDKEVGFGGEQLEC